MDIILKLKEELVRIKAELKEIKKQLSIIYLSLINEIRHSEKSDLSINTPFQHKSPFQNQRTNNCFPSQDLRIQKKRTEEKRWITSSIT